MSRSLGLRDRKKLDTRKALSDAALSLVFERGLDNVTREDIAARAGVSVRTFGNYFAGKYDVLAYRQVERVRRSLVALRGRPAGEPIWTAISAAVTEPLEADGADDFLPSTAHLTELRKLMLAPEARMAISNEVFADWVEVIAERTGTDPLQDLYPRLVAGAVRAVVEAALDTYVHADPPVNIVTLLKNGFSAVATGLSPPTTR